MTSSRVDRAIWLAEQLTLANIPSTADVQKVTGLAAHYGAAVLVVPPVLSFDVDGGATVEWSLFAISSGTVPTLDVWRKLDDLIVALEVELPVEQAAPASYAVSPGADAAPAYRITYTESVG